MEYFINKVCQSVAVFTARSTFHAHTMRADNIEAYAIHRELELDLWRVYNRALFFSTSQLDYRSVRFRLLRRGIASASKHRAQHMLRQLDNQVIHMCDIKAHYIVYRHRCRASTRALKVNLFTSQKLLSRGYMYARDI